MQLTPLLTIEIDGKTIDFDILIETDYDGVVDATLRLYPDPSDRRNVVLLEHIPVRWADDNEPPYHGA